MFTCVFLAGEENSRRGRAEQFPRRLDVPAPGRTVYLGYPSLKDAKLMTESLHGSYVRETPSVRRYTKAYRGLASAREGRMPTG